MKVIYLITLVLLLTNCRTPCVNNFETGDKITFVQNDEINGIILGVGAYDCDRYLVSYFTMMGKNEVAWFDEMELKQTFE